MHAETLWQCDFFSKRMLSRRGIRQAFALVFLNIATRRVWVSPCTTHPRLAWAQNQAQAFMRYVGQHGLQVDLVTHDRDCNFRPSFDAVLTEGGARVQKLAYRSPNLNAYVERFIQSIQQECLDHFLVFGEQHFDYLVREYVAHYHEERPHQGLENRLVIGQHPPAPPDADGQIHCRTRLGGLLKHYYRAAG